MYMRRERGVLGSRQQASEPRGGGRKERGHDELDSPKEAPPSNCVHFLRSTPLQLRETENMLLEELKRSTSMLSCRWGGSGGGE